MTNKKIIKSDYYYKAEVAWRDLEFIPGTDKQSVILEATQTKLKKIFKKDANKLSFIDYGIDKHYYEVRKLEGYYFIIDLRLSEDYYNNLDKDLQKLFTKDTLAPITNENGKCCYCGQLIKD